MNAPVKASKRTHQARWIAVLWTTPALLFYVLFALVPMLTALYLSFTRWDGLSQATWVGWQNWATLFTDPVTGHSFLLTLAMMALCWLIQTPLSLLLGVFMAGVQRYRAVLS